MHAEYMFSLRPIDSFTQDDSCNLLDDDNFHYVRNLL